MVAYPILWYFSSFQKEFQVSRLSFKGASSAPFLTLKYKGFPEEKIRPKYLEESASNPDLPSPRLANKTLPWNSLMTVNFKGH